MFLFHFRHPLAYTFFHHEIVQKASFVEVCHMMRLLSWRRHSAFAFRNMASGLLMIPARNEI
jgi:hypothetical protein